jgi:rod shape-determining protein MreD
MRWIPILLLAYVLVLLQATVGDVLTWTGAPIGAIGPDLLAVAAVFLALYAPTLADAMLAGWVLGLALDLSTAGSPAGATAVGPMALGYAFAAAIIFQMREAVFRERKTTQMLLALLFCGVSHGLWITLQSLLSWGEVSWSGYGRLWAQAGALAAYTALLMPLGYAGLKRLRRWFVSLPAGRRVRMGR